jgi:ADP-ribose pyrophosphatase YjhB (NUDIX family)
MSITTLNCNNGCCVLKRREWVGKVEDDHIRLNSNKAGVVLFDDVCGSILLVQSRGNLWGMPKGTLEPDELPITGAVREVREETGLELDPSLFGRCLTFDTSIYYIVPFEQTEVTIQTDDRNNDANGIGWVKLSCIHGMLQNEKIKLTSHARKIIRKINFII